jgi:hypothetical protein
MPFSPPTELPLGIEKVEKSLSFTPASILQFRPTFNPGGSLAALPITVMPEFKQLGSSLLGV